MFSLIDLKKLWMISEGEIRDGEQTAQSLQCDDCKKLFRDGRLITINFNFNIFYN
jgi:hypothetical protein